ncbi:MAG: hypothetical protein HN704_12875 [Bacteroidetes bacterium]|jgi:hypothetical protein|nr:hypothetical protein [Bacteroidota bacterium]MBT6686759.1 hypothetical protein [Bacteroidota bacterium]MBT7142002.1 hypothetical protein [Bacteroidota bacterium]MBT7492488.1 hypothetical protein [Bacteroidota bacterium]
MKKIIVLSVLLFASCIIVNAQNDEKEKDAIKKVIQSAYIDGLINDGDEKAVSNGFHPGFSLIGIGQGNSMWNYPIYNWIENMKIDKKNGKLPKKDEDRVSIKFLYVDVSGTAASAKIEFYVGKELKYIDYLSLYKFEEGWKIVGKIFYEFPAEKKK